MFPWCFMRWFLCPISAKAMDNPYLRRWLAKWRFYRCFSHRFTLKISHQRVAFGSPIWNRYHVPRGQLRRPPCASRFHKSWLPPRVARHLDVRTGYHSETKEHLWGIAVQRAWAVSFCSRALRTLQILWRGSQLCCSKKDDQAVQQMFIKTYKNLCYLFCSARHWGHCLHPNEQLTLVQLVGQRNLAEQDVTSMLNLSQNSPKGSYL